MNETQQNRYQFLKATAQKLQAMGRHDLGKNPLFSRDFQTLDGFQLAFMNPDHFRQFCARYGVDPESSEAVMMQTAVRTRAHVHKVGDSLFLPLGPAEGFNDSQGGTYIKRPGLEGKATEGFNFISGVPGEIFRVPAGYAHFFEPAQGAKFTAIACVSPRIQRPDGTFDIHHL